MAIQQVITSLTKQTVMKNWVRKSLIEKEGVMKGLMVTIVAIAGLLLSWAASNY
jgi:hypothetical protein